MTTGIVASCAIVRWFHNNIDRCDNRFLNPAMANKNRIQPPSKIVHFFNTPPDLTEEIVNKVFIERGIEAPTTIKLFPLKSERSSSGLIEFSSVGAAVAAIMECNHTALENSSTSASVLTSYFFFFFSRQFLFTRVCMSCINAFSLSLNN